MDRKKLALIHIIKKELKLSDPQYRSILIEATGVNSAKDLDDEKFRKLMNYFVRSRLYRKSSTSITVKQKIYIKYLAKRIGWSGRHLHNFLRKYYHKSYLDRLTKRQAAKVIVALRSIDTLIDFASGLICYGHLGAWDHPRKRLQQHRDQLLLWRKIIAAQIQDSTRENLISNCLAQLLKEDAWLAGFFEMPPAMRAREQEFLQNSIKGFLEFVRR